MGLTTLIAQQVVTSLGIILLDCYDKFPYSGMILVNELLESIIPTLTRVVCAGLFAEHCFIGVQQRRREESWKMTHGERLHSTISSRRSLDSSEGAGHVGGVEVRHNISQFFRHMLLDPVYANRDIFNGQEGKSTDNATPVLDR